MHKHPNAENSLFLCIDLRETLMAMFTCVLLYELVKYGRYVLKGNEIPIDTYVFSGSLALF